MSISFFQCRQPSHNKYNKNKMNNSLMLKRPPKFNNPLKFTKK